MLELRWQLPAKVCRNEVLPEKVPATGLVILLDSEPGEPDITLNPHTEFYAHRAELEVYVPREADGSGEAALDRLLSQIGSALRVDKTLGGLAGLSARTRSARWYAENHRY